jgi:hypothetical protein
MNQSILFYLRKINPIVAIFIFLWCSWIYFSPIIIEIYHHTFKLSLLKTLINGGENYISMYIFIKGVFCSIILWIVGEYFKNQYLKSN